VRPEPAGCRGPSTPAAFAPLASLLEQISGTASTRAKVEYLAAYLSGLDEPDLRWACTFLSGAPFPAGDPRRLMVGWAAIADVVRDLTRVTAEEFQATYLTHGDLGATAADLLTRHPPAASLFPDRLTLRAVAEAFAAIASAQGASSRRSKMAALRALLLDAMPLEAKYLIRIITSDMRVGLREGLLLPGIAGAFGRDPAAVRRAALLVADIGEVAVRARAGMLEDAALVPGRPFRFMLASAVTAPADALEETPLLLVEDKYDGIRVQVHRTGGGVVMFSRTLDDATAAFPELHAPLATLGHTYILDGEVIAWKEGAPLGFARLQQRLQRRDPGPLLHEIPVALIVFDILHLDGQDLLKRPLAERREILERLPFGESVRVSTAGVARTPDDLADRFDRARAAGHEGIVMKRPDAPYEPGRRGRWWLKWKPGVATLDVVVVAAEYGHGKRAGVLSDYTFAVRDGARLATIGKAYSGLTDAEIARLSAWFVAHTVRDLGAMRIVEPRIVLEVAFDLITMSDRHDSGFALRFPRIVRIRDDKPPEEINTLEEVRTLHAQLARAPASPPTRGSAPRGGAARQDEGPARDEEALYRNGEEPPSEA
jgi:DNA ligase-1